MGNLKIGVCKGRHEMPVNAFIFGGEISPELLTNPEELEELALDSLLELTGLKCACGHTHPQGHDGYCHLCSWDMLPTVNTIDLYVTGLTVAVFAVVNAAKTLDIEVTLYHFDREPGEYFAQKAR